MQAAAHGTTVGSITGEGTVSAFPIVEVSSIFMPTDEESANTSCETEMAPSTVLATEPVGPIVRYASIVRMYLVPTDCDPLGTEQSPLTDPVTPELPDFHPDLTGTEQALVEDSTTTESPPSEQIHDATSGLPNLPIVPSFVNPSVAAGARDFHVVDTDVESVAFGAIGGNLTRGPPRAEYPVEARSGTSWAHPPGTQASPNVFRNAVGVRFTGSTIGVGAFAAVGGSVIIDG